MLEISNNSSSIMRSCPKKYEFTYIYGLKPIKKSSALSLGSILHEAFHMYYSNFSPVDVLKYIHETMDEEIAKAGPHEAEDLEITKHTLIGMWGHYPYKMSDFPKIEPELEFKVKVPGTRGILFVGKVDGLITDHNKKLWVRELKTTAQTFQQFEVKSKQSSQATGYVWAMRMLGYPVEGVIYDYVKKPLLRKGVNENSSQFGRRIIDDYQSRPDIYYKRHYTYRSKEDLRMFENDLRQVAYDIRRRTKTGMFYRNPDQCWNFNSECPYLKICFKEQPDQLTMDLYYEQKATQNKGG